MGKYFTSKTMFALAMAGTVIVAPSLPTKAAEPQYQLSVDARYESGVQNPDGGTTEIIAYNKHNHSVYLINGDTKLVEKISLNYSSNNAMNLQPDFSVDVAELIQKTDPDFVYGGLPSIAVSPNENIVVVAVQAEDYTKEGYAVFLTGDGDLLSIVKTGVQPDNITFSPDGTKVLTANEGEPRNGYGEDIIDPQGTVSVIDLQNGFTNLTTQEITFEVLDHADKRAELVNDQVILKKDAKPSEDLEPEYVVVSEDSNYAYVSLQENNAIAKIDLTTNEAISVKGLGFKDHQEKGNELDLLKNKEVKLQNENVFGIYMPDGISTYSVNGKNYIVTANEGDSREWGEEDTPTFHLNEDEKEVNGSEIVFYDTTHYDGFEDGKDYIFGGRSFSIFDAETMEIVFDSGSDFEKITAKLFPEYFNTTNDDVKLDNRSGKKGPEPEDVKVGKIGDEVFAFIGLERIGGIMMYNITDPTKVEFVDYLNTRDFSESIKGDVSPEGLAFVTAEKPQLLVGHEVSGTVTVFDLLAKDKDQPFNDIDNHHAKNEIIKVTQAGLLTGVNETTFAPDKPFTGAQAATVFNRLVGNTNTNTNAIDWAIENNLLIAGTDPNKEITREEFANAVYSYLVLSGETFEEVIADKYQDDAQISTEAKQTIYALQSKRIMIGSAHAFNPSKSLTRAEAAIVLSRLFD